MYIFVLNVYYIFFVFLYFLICFCQKSLDESEIIISWALAPVWWTEDEPKGLKLILERIQRGC